MYNVLNLVMICPRCGVSSAIEAEFRFGLRNLTQYQLGDTIKWEGKGTKTPTHRPPGGNYLGEAYAVCQHCQRDFWLRVIVRADTIASVELDSTRQPYIPDSSLAQEVTPGAPVKISSNKFSARSKGHPMQINWIEIPAGEFVFGLSEEQRKPLLNRIPSRFATREANLIQRESPEKTVRLETFYISRYPITWEQYYQFALSSHRYSHRNTFAGDHLQTILTDLKRLAETQGDHPADANWHYALAFCDWLGARLPTSAEWEKSARGVDGRLYPWGNNWDPTRGNFGLDRQRHPQITSPVTAYPMGQSPYNVMDMAGNVYEWTCSTMFGTASIQNEQEQIVCRSCSCDFEPGSDTPDWFRNRVTSITLNAMNFGGASLVGFRPVLDQWLKRYWTGV